MYAKKRFWTSIALCVCLLRTVSVVGAQYSEGEGTGDPNAPYQIAMAADLITLGESPEDYDKHFVLTADIDLDPNLPEGRIFDRAVIAPDTDDAKDRFQGTPFTGVFEGNGHVISNLHIRGSGYVGLFGLLNNGAVVSNVSLYTADIRGTGDYVGGLVAYNYDGNITASYSDGEVQGRGWVGGLVGTNWGSLTDSSCAAMVDGTEYVGGLVGYNYEGPITTSYSTGEVIGGRSVGGLVGCSDGGGSLADSYSTGGVTGVSRVGGLVGYQGLGDITRSHSTSTTSGNEGVGGLVGRNDGTIKTSHSGGAVSGEGWVGGLVGYNGGSGSVSDSYSMGAVSGGDRVGGLVGSNAGSIAASYSTGAVDGGSTVGGLVGANPGSVTASFWDTETSGQAVSAGGTGQTTAQMQSTSAYLEAGWDFVGESDNGTDDIWWVDGEAGCPRLSWEEQPEDPNDPGAIEAILPAHRLWSSVYETYFYTTDGLEKDELLQDAQGAWAYEGVAFYVYGDEDEPGLVPVHRFHSEILNSYFYTASEPEKNKIVDQFSDVWSYRGIAFHVFPDNDPSDTLPVHRFWSDSIGCHFYTIDDNEKAELIAEESDVWIYEGVVWYAYADPPATAAIATGMSPAQVD